MSNIDSKPTPQTRRYAQHTKTHYTGFAAQVQMDLISSRHTSPRLSPRSTKELIITWDTEHKYVSGFNMLTMCSTLSRSSKLNAIPLKRKNGKLSTQPSYTFRLLYTLKQTVHTGNQRSARTLTSFQQWEAIFLWMPAFGMWNYTRQRILGESST